MRAFIVGMVAGFVFLILTEAASAAAKNSTNLYLVEPMICKGQWNQQPPSYQPSYAVAGIRVTSLWSTLARDCSLVASSATESEYAEIGRALVFRKQARPSGWFGEPLRVNGNIVSAPFGVWGRPIELKIISSKTVGRKRLDVLQGRDVISKGYYYDLWCDAVVVQKPALVINDTSNCP